MINKVVIGVHYNLYESKIYFADKFKEALERRGIQALLFNSSDGKQIAWPKYYDFSCSFNSTLPQPDGRYFWDISKIPHWSILVDPFFYYTDYLKSPLSILSCVDRLDVEHLKNPQFQNAFFWPHAVEPELDFDRKAERPYDVVMLGSCYDEETLKQHWRAGTTPQVVKVIEEAIEIVLGDNHTHIYDATMQALDHYRLSPKEVPLNKILFYVDNYSRGYDRVQLIKSIKNAQVHVFGGTCWRDEKPILGWSNSLVDMPNVTIHPAVPYAESLEIMKKSKIVLNSTPFFKSGSHERTLTSLACGALPITSDNLWVRENFLDGRDLKIYPPGGWDKVNGWVDDYLQNEKKRMEIVEQGRTVVMNDHTWDNRVETMIKEIPPILERIKNK
jgi:glycosyltransferase involved in cell wall biosynthesis